MKMISGGSFVDEDASVGRPGTIVSAEWLQAVQDELIAMVTRFGGTLGGRTQIADLVEGWRARGDYRAALQWAEVDTMMLTGSIIWAGAAGGEYVCITDSLGVFRVTADAKSESLGSIADGVQASCIAVKDAPGGYFSVAVADSSRMIRLFKCRVQRRQMGIGLFSAERWAVQPGSTPTDYSGLSIGAESVEAVVCYCLGGVDSFESVAFALSNGDMIDLDDFAAAEVDEWRHQIPVAICGSVLNENAVVIGLNGPQVIHLGVPETGLDALSNDATWLAAVASESPSLPASSRRVRWFPSVGRVCVWASSARYVWIGDPAGHVHTSLAWRRVTLSGPIVDLVELGGMLVGISASGSSIDCYHLHATQDPVLLASASAPGCGMNSMAPHYDAWAAVANGVLFGQAHGYLFASAALGEGLVVRPAVKCDPMSQSALLSPDFGGRALQFADNRLLISGMF